LELEPINQKEFTDESILLEEEASLWREECQELRKIASDDFARLSRQARELAAVAFWQRDERIALEWQPGAPVSRVLAFLLPCLVGVKVLLLEKGASEEAILSSVREEKIDRVVLQRRHCDESFIKALTRDGVILQLLAKWQGEEALLSRDGVFPSLLEDGKIVTWSMPHPNENSLLATFQPGWKEGSVGRLLPATTAPEGWKTDSERFLYPCSG
jgi:hypothetical protein